MNNEKNYDCAIIGGGLGGLSLSIQLSKAGYSVILFEKEQYPFHRVCGEYISMESWDHLQSLGLPLPDMQLPRINKLFVTSPGGYELKHDLQPGGFGISRYKIDNELKTIALQQAVVIVENCKVENAVLRADLFHIHTNKGMFTSLACCGSFGKRSNIDIQWKRGFTKQPPDKLNNYIGVKYHIRTNFAADSIALHNFKNGYCGISKIEDDKYCLCYLTNAENLKESNNSIDQMEKNILSENRHLKDIFENSIKLFEHPVSISQVSFQKKSQVENNVLLVGDAAGMITPLCGNGMSMALHAAKIAATEIVAFLQHRVTRKQMEENYAREWRRLFEKRLRTGRLVQRFFGKKWITDVFIRTMKIFPSLTRWLIKQTHGDSF